MSNKRPRTEDPMGSVPMTAEEEAEARRLMEIAERAERRVAERERAKTTTMQLNNDSISSSGNNNSMVDGLSKPAAKFLTKEERAKLALERLENKRKEEELKRKAEEEAHDRFVTGKALEERMRQDKLQAEREEEERLRRQRDEKKEAKEIDQELKAIRTHYLGGAEKKKRPTKPSEKFAKIFQFDWEEGDDTAKDDVNPLYCNRVQIHALFGRGYVAGVDQKEQRKGSNFLLSLSDKRMEELKKLEESVEGLSEREKKERANARDRAFEQMRRQQLAERNASDSFEKMGTHWSDKSLDQMTERDWRIFREDFDIRIQGGRATLPLRHWHEGDLPEELLDAIKDAGYEKPSPIQRQAIPIGLARRDIIGIAETGSGKTAAFLIPLLSFMLRAPSFMTERCDAEGPLAVVMAPTRELAQQIEEECIKLSKYTKFVSTCIVGGQSIEEQGFKLRKGVHIVIGTPGRLCDCLQNNYLVLNQCNYVVLDEADRMVDMGFEPQVLEVLDAMGGLLKSEDEEQAEQQITTEDPSGGALYRVTAMFSATMPTEVERIAKTYLRHPSIIKIGDEDTGKNKRIEQRVLFIAEGQKKNKLSEEMRKLSSAEKAIVFVNAKKQADVIGRFLDSIGLRNGVLHGGRSQDQREETLEHFRKGVIQMLVATDVAGRGLDIPDVSHVVNFDCPTKIENYCHRIGRTGRAGRYGVATSFLTDSDTEIMYDLKNYLESTGAAIPQQLAKHPSAQAPAGSRDEKGNIVGQKRDAVKYSSR